MEPDGERSHDELGGVFRRVLVAFDGAVEAQRALRVAIALAADLHGKVHVLLVVRLPAYTETSDERAAAVDAERKHLSQGLSDVLGQTRHRVEVTTDVAFADDPAKEIVRQAHEHGADLIVVGAHGREQMTHRGIGHSIEALLAQHPCPVLVV
ncbi:MAG: universal stress protein [Acidimicrobiales bacterium]